VGPGGGFWANKHPHPGSLPDPKGPNHRKLEWGGEKKPKKEIGGGAGGGGAADRIRQFGASVTVFWGRKRKNPPPGGGWRGGPPQKGGKNNLFFGKPGFPGGRGAQGAGIFCPLGGLVSSRQGGGGVGKLLTLPGGGPVPGFFFWNVGGGLSGGGGKKPRYHQPRFQAGGLNWPCLGWGAGFGARGVGVFRFGKKISGRKCRRGVRGARRGGGENGLGANRGGAGKKERGAGGRAPGQTNPIFCLGGRGGEKTGSSGGGGGFPIGALKGLYRGRGGARGSPKPWAPPPPRGGRGKSSFAVSRPRR